VNEVRRIHARGTSFSEISLEAGLEFVRLHHSQGVAVPGKNAKAYALKLDDEVLSVAIFCNPRTSGMQKRYTTELFRLAFKGELRIPGGASKLIRNFLKVSNTHALFTYQDTAGEATDVYAHAGGVLKGKSNPTKQVLVKDGLTRAQAENNHSDWFSLELASRLGPDALIGTSLGEVIDENGKRKNNLRLFVEHCGYHLETIPGDRIYEWQNADRTFYVYKLTTAANSSYYIGRRSVLRAGVKAQECATDGYLGSGGEKLKLWRSELAVEQIHKEILGVYPTWEKVLQAEAKFIGDSYLTDPDCLNMVAGGHWSGFGAFQPNYLKKLCAIHGETTHKGDKCARCISEGSMSVRLCPIHGEVKHIGEKCYSCRSQNITTDDCAIHGATTFRHGHCGRCLAVGAISLKTCPIHGETTFNGTKCTACQSEKTYVLKECATHGLTKHQGNVCNSCLMNSNYTLQECAVHGETKFKGGKCHRCALSSAYYQAECPKHGLGAFTKTNGCRRCKREQNKAKADIQTDQRKGS
jgi:hypothetical protein